MHQGPVLSPFLFAVVVDVTEFARMGALSKLLYADDLVLMCETIEGLKNKFLKWMHAFDSKGLKVILGKTKVMVSGGITNDGLSKSNVDPCWVCSLRVMANSVLCVQYGKWIHIRCPGLKMVTPKFFGNFTCTKCEGHLEEAVEQEVMLCDEVETVGVSKYLSDRVSVGGECDAAVTVITRCGWDMFKECGELLYSRRFHLRLKAAVYKSYVRPTILYKSGTLCLKESEIEIL